ncbi:hypothetical protein Vadar_034161 [Vaccinium darrowii]|uniref:Uncharacterized protein n=1 Tax=Vaccinium darrowii TaxID=229202 RepID=A0ACB7Y5E0_9ERIC|nr:hypothetical protein Vadar_034161 [Vaccinium darrowii]
MQWTYGERLGRPFLVVGIGPMEGRVWHRVASIGRRDQEGDKQNVDAEFVKQLEGEFGFIKCLEEFKGQDVDKEANCLGFTSWSNSGHYTIDFGWGKPAWAS